MSKVGRVIGARKMVGMVRGALRMVGISCKDDGIIVRLSSQYMVGMTREKEAVLSPESAGLAGGNEWSGLTF